LIETLASDKRCRSAIIRICLNPQKIIVIQTVEDEIVGEQEDTRNEELHKM